MDSNRWSLAIGDAGDAETDGDGAPGSDLAAEDTTVDGDPPPETAD
jgi:hypothetical protein